MYYIQCEIGFTGGNHPPLFLDVFQELTNDKSEAKLFNTLKAAQIINKSLNIQYGRERLYWVVEAATGTIKRNGDTE